MGLLSSRRIARAVDAAYDALDGEQQDPFAIMKDLDDDERLPAFLGLAERLVDEEAYDHARLAVEQALAIAPESWEALGLLVQAERHDPERRPQAIETLRRMLKVDPGNADVTCDLAFILTESEQAEEALKLLIGLEDRQNPVVVLRTGEALTALGRLDEAAAALGELRELYNYRLKHGMLHGDAYEMREHMMEASRLYQEIQAELHERDGGTAHKPKRDAEGDLDFVQLGQTLLAASERIALDLELRSPEETLAAAESRVEKDDKDAAGLALLGSVHLRQGDLDNAHRRFESAGIANHKCFAAFLGLAATADCAAYEWIAAAESLPAPPAKVDVAKVVPDWAALTDLERKVVWAAVHPLRGTLPALERAGTRLRILPIDVRPADVEGAGGASVGLARIERLLDVQSPAGWSFAHELARLAHQYLPAVVRDQIAVLRTRATEAGWFTDETPPATDAEFMAIAYTDFLRQRHGLIEYLEPDAQGVHHDVLALFAQLADREKLEG